MSGVDDSTRKAVDKIVERILRDGDLRKPPVQIIDIIEHLKLHRDFYSLDDPKLLQRVAHRIQIGTKKIVNVVRDKIRLVLSDVNWRYVGIPEGRGFSVWCHEILYSSCQEMLYSLG